MVYFCAVIMNEILENCLHYIENNFLKYREKFLLIFLLIFTPQGFPQSCFQAEKCCKICQRRILNWRKVDADSNWNQIVFTIFSIDLEPNGHSVRLTNERWIEDPIIIISFYDCIDNFTFAVTVPSSRLNGNYSERKWKLVGRKWMVGWMDGLFQFLRDLTLRR